MEWNKGNDNNCSIYQLNMQLYYIMRSKISDVTAKRLKDVIKNLTDNGADINFLNIKFDNDTPLHTAVRLKNLRGAEALLGFNAYTDIKNRNEETSEDLAGDSEWKQLLELHRNNKPEEFVGIDSAFIGQIQCGQMPDETHSKFRILRIDCKTTEKALECLNSGELKLHSKNCFVLVLRILENEAPDEEIPKKIETIMQLFRRPVIIQLVRPERQAETEIYYRDNDKRIRKIHSSDLSEEIIFGLNLDFELLIQGCIQGVFGSFDGDLTNIQLRIGPILRFLAGQSLQQNNICLRFFSLFQDFFNEKMKIAYIIANIRNEIESTLKIVLGLTDTSTKEDLFQKLYRRIMNGCPIMISVEQDNVEVLKYFLKYQTGYDIDAAAALAFDKRHYQCLVELIISAEAKFPIDFDLNDIKDISSREKIETFVNKNIRLLELMKAGKRNEKEIIRIIDGNPHRRTYYDYTNNSALAMSWPRQSIYFTLVERHFKIGNSVEFDKKLWNDSCWLVNKQTDWFTRPTELHLNILLMKFRIRKGEGEVRRSKRLEFAKNFCESASKIEVFSKILEEISCQRKLSIFLDHKYPSTSLSYSTWLPLADTSSNFIHVPAATALKNKQHDNLIQSALIYKLTSKAIKAAMRENENHHSFPKNSLYTNIQGNNYFSSAALKMEAVICRAMQLKVIAPSPPSDGDSLMRIYDFVTNMKFSANGQPTNPDSKKILIFNAINIFSSIFNRFCTCCLQYTYGYGRNCFCWASFQLSSCCS